MDDVTPRARLEVGPASDGVLVLRLGGELDLAALPAVQPEVDRLLARPPQAARIDAADLRFMDSTGVTVLIRIANHFRPVELVHARPPVRRVVEVLGLSAHLGLEGT
mgnify:FL=1